ncbi:MAG: tRNA uridine-5-carboxymethylaminomethyl(34) synthesis GTPase MnmE [Candidatus Polarisedimenticolaceae bacterium]|nr:tRNA uridine-5-carboxymethylaminomethyl(34) synthesis GTPase MnmE [Candidatus Polarisedimenticolaceae bacterium]
MSTGSQDTIAAIATPAGRGGVGIIRVSGGACQAIAEAILGTLPEPRRASFSPFKDASDTAIDEGIALYFPTPNSFTGEDILELQGHGGPVVMDMLLEEVIKQGARLARPGEFSERAFLNGKLDLLQAEAIADLIEADTATAVRLANRSLQGEFSRCIHSLVDAITQLRIYLEAAMDFPEEEIDFLSDGKVSADLQSIIHQIEDVQKKAKIGRLLRDGMQLVIAGQPNAGKSSLLNALVGRDSAIVTEIPGTTRDLLREQIQIDGMPLHLVDTAGLRESEDRIELEGIKRAREEINRADHILWVFDDQTDPKNRALNQHGLPADIPLTQVRNKIDLTGRKAGIRKMAEGAEVSVSASTGEGMDLLREHLKQSMGYQGASEGEFIARRRHLTALSRAEAHLLQGQKVLCEAGNGELLAEDLRQSQNSLSEITGEFSADDLLGEIFSSFCIGK